jgi:prepilin-type N-terminal cleavage/methylation domain-containing protein
VKRAFTLLELVVVVAVLAVLTRAAVGELGRIRDAKLSRAADAQLEEIRAAAAAFLADVGRLPRLAAETNSAGEVTWTLSELWRRPDGMDAQRLEEKDLVQVAVGWGGPYLRLPFGRNRLLDPWGNPVELFDSASLRRLWVDERLSVTGVCHYGASGHVRDRKTVSLVPDGGATATVLLDVDAGDYEGVVTCAWYGPYENSVTNSPAATAPAGTQIVFRDVPLGLKMFRTVTDRTVVRTVEVGSGVNRIKLKAR